MASYRSMVWLAILIYTALALFVWLDYFMAISGYATLEGALLYTIAAPIVTFAAFRIHRMISQVTGPKFWQWAWTIFGALFFGFIIYAIVNLFLYTILSLPIWVQMGADLRTVLTMPASYVIGAFLGYWFGKRRQFRTPFF
jgi:hypothetical protein